MSNRFLSLLVFRPRPVQLITTCVVLAFGLMAFAAEPIRYQVAAAETAKNVSANHPTLHQAKRLIEAGQAEEVHYDAPPISRCQSQTGSAR